MLLIVKTNDNKTKIRDIRTQFSLENPPPQPTSGFISSISVGARNDDTLYGPTCPSPFFIFGSPFKAKFIWDTII
jgi:hypothetical protein